MYQVSHQDPKKGGAKPATLGYSTQDVDTASRGDPWVKDTNLDYVEPFAEVFAHSPYNIFFEQL